MPELNLGQLVYDVERAYSPFEVPVIHYGKVGGGIPIYPSELVSKVLEVLRR